MDAGTFVIAERAPAQPWTRSPESITMGAIPMRRTTLLVLLTLALLPLWLLSQDKKATVISVDAARPGATISPSMFGIFFEDINFAADGGLYPELVKNRSFEFQQPLSGWHEVLGYSEKGLDRPKGELAVHTEDPLNQTNPHYLRVRVLRSRLCVLELWLSRYRCRKRSRIPLLCLCSQLRPEVYPRQAYR